MFEIEKREFTCDICGKKIDDFIYDLTLNLAGETTEEMEFCENCLPFVQLALRNFRFDLIEEVNNYRFYFWER